MRGPMRAVLAIAAFALLSGTGCRSPCVQLAERICECEATQTEREVCVRRAQEEQNRTATSDEEGRRCASLVPGCDCTRLSTSEGKIACGLARGAAPDGGI